jgi:hypothetical protein
MLQIIKKSTLLLAFFVFANNIFGQQEICVTIPQIENAKSASTNDINCSGGDVTLNLLINQESELSDNFIDEVNKVLQNAGINYIIASGTAPFSDITLTFNGNYTDIPDEEHPRIVVLTSENQSCSSGIKLTQGSCGR